MEHVGATEDIATNALEEARDHCDHGPRLVKRAKVDDSKDKADATTPVPELTPEPLVVVKAGPPDLGGDEAEAHAEPNSDELLVVGPCRGAVGEGHGEDT